MCGYEHMRKDAYRVQRRMSPGPGVTCGCELPQMGAANKYPEPLRHLSWPSLPTIHLINDVCFFSENFFYVGHKLKVFLVSRCLYLPTSSATHLAVSAQSVRTFVFSLKFENISFLSFGFCYLKTICLIQASLLLYNFIFSIGYF